jgi:hypothetical protein
LPLKRPIIIIEKATIIKIRAGKIDPAWAFSAVPYLKKPRRGMFSMDRKPLLTKEEMTEIKMRCERATAGPWRSNIEARDEACGRDIIGTESDNFHFEGASVDDQDFIAHARQDIPNLIAEIERLMTESEFPLLTRGEVVEIKRRCERATAGPWKSYIEARDKISGPDFIMTEGEDIYIGGATVDDHDFIAYARQDIPKLVAEVERLTPAIESDCGKISYTDTPLNCPSCGR